MSELPHDGVHITIVQEASVLHKQMSQELAATASLEAAISQEALLRDDGLRSLQAALAEAEAVSAPSESFDALLSDARKTLIDLERANDAKRQLQDAVRARDLTRVSEAVAEALSIPLDSHCPELQEATILKQELEQVGLFTLRFQVELLTQVVLLI